MRRLWRNTERCEDIAFIRCFRHALALAVPSCPAHTYTINAIKKAVFGNSYPKRQLLSYPLMLFYSSSVFYIPSFPEQPLSDRWLFLWNRIHSVLPQDVCQLLDPYEDGERLLPPVWL